MKEMLEYAENRAEQSVSVHIGYWIWNIMQYHTSLNMTADEDQPTKL